MSKMDGNEALRSEVEFLKGEIDHLRSELDSIRSAMQTPEQRAAQEWDQKIAELDRKELPSEEALREKFLEQNAPEIKADMQSELDRSNRAFDAGVLTAEQSVLMDETAKRLADRRSAEYIRQNQERFDAFIVEERAKAASDLAQQRAEIEANYKREIEDAKQDVLDEVEDENGGNGASTDVDFSDEAPMLKEEVEPDSVVLKGQTYRHPTKGYVTRRDDRSLEWVKKGPGQQENENAVMRFYKWDSIIKETYDLFTDQKDPNADENDDGVRFLVRVYKDPKDPSKGATLKYYKLLRYQKTTCDESDSDSDSDGEEA